MATMTSAVPEMRHDLGARYHNKRSRKMQLACWKLPWKGTHAKKSCPSIGPLPSSEKSGVVLGWNDWVFLALYGIMKFKLLIQIMYRRQKLLFHPLQAESCWKSSSADLTLLKNCFLYGNVVINGHFVPPCTWSWNLKTQERIKSDLETSLPWVN